jgi:Protein of unknown function (DUF2934)
MSSRYQRDSHYENHPRAAELRDIATHAHEVGELHGKQEHPTGSERAQEAPRRAHESTVGHGIAAFGHDDIASLAHERWEARGRPEGSPEEDWFEAVKELRLRALSHA